MRSECVTRQFLECLRAFLTDEPPVSYLEQRSDEELEELLLLAGKHKVIPMVYEGLRRLPEYGELPQNIRDAFRRNALFELVTQTQKDAQLGDIYGKIRERGIPCLALKGVACRRYYSRPDCRISGDEDLLIGPGDRDMVHQLLTEEGYQRVQGGEIEGELVWSYDRPDGPLHIELHQGFFSGDKRMDTLNACMAHSFDRCIHWEQDGTRYASLGSTDEFLYLMLHALKHFMVCGVGIRQICDITQLIRREKELDWVYLHRQLKQAGGERFAYAVLEIGERFLGCPIPEGWKREAGAVGTDIGNLMEDILEGGVYGKATGARCASACYTGYFSKNERKRSLAWVAARRLLPSAHDLAGRYPILDRHPWPLPFCWIRRIAVHVRKLLTGEVSGGWEAEGLRVGQKRMELLEQYGVTRWQQ